MLEKCNEKSIQSVTVVSDKCPFIFQDSNFHKRSQMTRKTRQKHVRRMRTLSQTYLFYFYIIRTGNLVINLLLFHEVSLQWFFSKFSRFPSLSQHLLYERDVTEENEAFEEKEALGFIISKN